MRREWVLGTAVASVVAVSALAGCDGGDDAATTTTPVPQTAASTQPAEPMAESVTTIASTTTTPATATTAPSTTTEPTTTERATTLPAETVPPPTDPPASTTLPDGVPPRLTFPDDPDKQAVVDAAYAFFDAARAAQASPADEALREQLAATMEGPISATLKAFLDGLVADDVRVVGGPENLNYLEIVSSTVVASDGAGTFDACSVDGDIRVRSSSEELVSANVGSAFVTYSLSLTNNGWRVQDVEVVRRYRGELGCSGR